MISKRGTIRCRNGWFVYSLEHAGRRLNWPDFYPSPLGFFNGKTAYHKHRELGTFKDLPQAIEAIRTAAKEQQV